MEKYVDIKSPFTGGKVKKIATVEAMEYKGKVYDVHVGYYQCEDTGEKFTTTKQDQEWYDELQTLAKAYKQYDHADTSCMVVAEPEETMRPTV